MKDSPPPLSPSYIFIYSHNIIVCRKLERPEDGDDDDEKDLAVIEPAVDKRVQTEEHTEAKNMIEVEIESHKSE
jgi:hypothetical protein